MIHPSANAAPAHAPRTGIVLVNTGTPNSPEVADVRRYLRQFLNDPRVIDMHPLARWLLLELIILPSRPAKSAAAYRAIWTAEGSPLMVHCQALARAVQAQLGRHVQVVLGMQYGSPSIAEAFDTLAAAGIDRVVIAPLFPHYASASFGSATAAVMKLAAERWVVPQVHVVPPFWDTPEFLAAVTEAARAQLAAFDPDHILLSYHGLPQHHCTQTDLTGQHCGKRGDCCDALLSANRNCYRAQCFGTSRAIVAALGLDPAQVTTAFQSRLGKVPWIRPYADEVITDLGKRGVRRLLVLEPSFVADCLETLEEIGIRGRHDFAAAGGGELRLVPSLNANALWVQGLAGLVRRSAAAWFEEK